MTCMTPHPTRTPDLDFCVNPYGNPDRRDLPGVVLTGPWRDGYAAVLRDRGVRALFLNSARGWQGETLDFLADLPFLEEVEVLARQPLDVAAVGRLPWLRFLGLTAATKQVVDFSGMTGLKEAFLTWWPGADSLLAHPGLEALRLDAYRPKAFAGLEAMPPKTWLSLTDSSVSDLGFLARHADLRRLTLGHCPKLTDFSPIGGLGKLERLEILGAKTLRDLSFLAGCPRLEVLNLSDCHEIASLRPLTGLTALKAFAMPGAKATIADGDLSPLEGLPNLAMLMFAPRRHYTHRLVKPWSWKNFDTPDRLLERVRP